MAFGATVAVFASGSGRLGFYSDDSGLVTTLPHEGLRATIQAARDYVPGRNLHIIWQRLLFLVGGSRPGDLGTLHVLQSVLDGITVVLFFALLRSLEHLSNPEEATRRIANILKPGGVLYASTGNVAFIVMRLSLALGQFNYGKRGILDLTHRRLFTTYSFKKLLINSGFLIDDVRGFGPPIRDMVGGEGVLPAVDTVAARLARLWPRLFAFNFLVSAQKSEELEDIYARTAG